MSKKTKFKLPGRYVYLEDYILSEYNEVVDAWNDHLSTLYHYKTPNFNEWFEEFFPDIYKKYFIAEATLDESKTQTTEKDKRGVSGRNI